jgi:hypothetical protein
MESGVMVICGRIQVEEILAAAAVVGAGILREMQESGLRALVLRHTMRAAQASF